MMPGRHSSFTDVISAAARSAASVAAALFDRLRGLLTAVESRPSNETEFLPAALEIIDTPPSPMARATAKLIIAFLVVAVLWASIGSVDVIAIAAGKIVPTSRTKLIQPLEAGVVRAIHVQDGQAVKAGEVLLEIDATINTAEQTRIEKEYSQAAVDVARLNAVRIAADGPVMAFLPPPDADPADVTAARGLLDSQVREIRARVANIGSQIDQNEAGRQAVGANIDKLATREPILRERHSRQQWALDRLSTAQDISDDHKEIAVQEMRLKEAAGAVAALEDQRRMVIAEFGRTVATELAQAQRKAASLGEQLVQARQRTRLQTLTAPVDGTVQQLSVHTEGGVVTPAQVLLALVPADAGLEIEVAVPNKDIGFVSSGQLVAIKVDTFNFTRYGLLDGTVLSVAQDAVTRAKSAEKVSAAEAASASSSSSEPQGQELVYVARIGLGTTSMDIDGKRIMLSPGMAVTAEIKTGTRRLIEYLLSPLQRAAHQAMRER